jgi:hypothetical protein
MKEKKPILLTSIMTDSEIKIALALGSCQFLPATSNKRFALSMSSVAENSKSISEPQRRYLYLLAIRMRRQINKDILQLIPDEYWKQYKEQKTAKNKREY